MPRCMIRSSYGTPIYKCVCTLVLLCCVTFMWLTHQITAEACALVCRCWDNIADCSYTDIGQVPLGNAFNFGIVTLNMAGNKVDNLEAEFLIHYVKLQNVTLKNNTITKIHPRAFQGQADGLMYLDLSENRIQTIFNITFTYAPKLQVLLLSNNSISILERNVFSGLKVLQQLDLSFNYISDISDGTFQWNEKLEFLSLSHNHIQSISGITFKFQYNLRHLDLSNNKINSINQDAFLSLGQLKWLSLSHNYINQLPSNIFKNLKKVENLTLYRNVLSVIHPLSFANCSLLKTLSVAHNHIVKLHEQSLYGLFNLTHFDVSHNKLTHLSPHVFSGNGSESSLTVIPPPQHDYSATDCSEHTALNYSLNFFIADNNELSSLDQCVFVPTPSLQVIDLAANNLTSLDYRIFFLLNNLSKLDMSFNKLSTVDDLSAKLMLDTETAINLTGNPWNCECDALYSVYNTLTVKTGRNITLWCENPAGVRGKSWDILEEECQPRTGSTVTAVLTTDTINSTANETEMTNTSDPTANETAMPDTSDPTANETAMLDTSDPTANGTKMTDSHTTESLALNSLPKASSSTSIIFVTAFSVAVCIIIAAVFMITRKVRKPNLNHRWWEDEFTRRELLSE